MRVSHGVIKKSFLQASHSEDETGNLLSLDAVPYAPSELI